MLSCSLPLNNSLKKIVFGSPWESSGTSQHGTRQQLISMISILFICICVIFYTDPFFFFETHLNFDQGYLLKDIILRKLSLSQVHKYHIWDLCIKIRTDNGRCMDYLEDLIEIILSETFQCSVPCRLSRGSGWAVHQQVDSFDLWYSTQGQFLCTVSNSGKRVWFKLDIFNNCLQHTGKVIMPNHDTN